MRVAALAGGVGAGKFLRGLVRVLPPENLTVIVNTGDDVRVHGLHVSPDVDSVTYWLGGVADRDRGWGRAGETFRTTEELRRFGATDAWFALGDTDLALHLFRAQLLQNGKSLSVVTAEVARRFGVRVRILAMTDDPVETRVEVVDEGGQGMDLHFQEFWVKRAARDEVKAIRYEGAESARPAGGVVEALHEADAVLICPSNPVASIAPILAIPGIRDALAGRRDRAAGVSPIVGGAPVRGMADKLLPAVGAEVSAAGAASCYRGLVRGWVIDELDRSLAGAVERQGFDVAVAPTLMVDDDAAESVAGTALRLALDGAHR
ncbi:MAG TPA: 2-phospho-L-lactate transferase [Actinomycetota bacterium]|nr:2-phospho-L-lactate transferase [Actinomycetota bacterium]